MARCLWPTSGRMEAQAAAMGHTDIDMDEERPKTDENVFLFVPVSPAMARPASDSLRSFSWKRLTTSRNHPRRCAESDRQVWIGWDSWIDFHGFRHADLARIHRILARYPRRRLAYLHELSSQDVYRSLRNIQPARRSRRSSGKGARPE